MKVCLFFILFFLANTVAGQNLPPFLQWQHSIGGSLEDKSSDIQSTSDGGFIIAGSSASADGDISLNRGRTDGLLIKFDAAGNIEWQKTYGGSYDDVLVKVKALSGGGYIATGYTTSNDGDVSGLHGGDDIWVIKLDNTGTILWQKCYGGSLNEFPESIFQTAGGGFVLYGHSTSVDGDVTGVHPNIGNLGDVWVVSLDATGNILWKRCYGGSGGESAGAMEQTTDGGFIFTSYSSSNDGDVSGNLNGDFWLVKLSSTGDIIWQKCFGGTAGETPYGLVQVADGYVLAGISLSDYGLSHNHGNADIWVLKTDLNGNLLWQQLYGGTEIESANAIIAAGDGGFFITGMSKSSDGNLCKNYGREDYVVLKINQAGNLEWQKTYGGTNTDQAFGIIRATDGSLFITGFSFSTDQDITANHGGADIWLIKLSYPGVSVTAGVNITASANNVCPGKNIQLTATPVNGGTNPVYHWYINNIEQQTVTGNVLNSSNFRNADSVYCKLTSNLICIDNPEAISNVIKIIIDTTGMPANFLPDTTSICEGVRQEIVSLKPFSSYLWSNGATTSSIFISSSGSYWLEVPYNNFCKSREYIRISPKKCNQSFYLPTAFTPDNNGKNDLLLPTIYGQVIKYNFSIYNRWGQLIFTSADPAKGWDGKWNGKKLDNNICIWVCTYQLSGDEVKTEKGTVLVLR